MVFSTRELFLIATIVVFLCLCMSEHTIYLKNVTNVTKKLHQNVTNSTKRYQTKHCIKRNRLDWILCYCRKLFLNILSIICVKLNTKILNMPQNFYFEIIWSKTQFCATSHNVTKRYMSLIRGLNNKFQFERPTIFTPPVSNTIESGKLPIECFHQFL